VPWTGGTPTQPQCHHGVSSEKNSCSTKDQENATESITRRHQVEDELNHDIYYDHRREKTGVGVPKQSSRVQMVC